MKKIILSVAVLLAPASAFADHGCGPNNHTSYDHSSYNRPWTTFGTSSGYRPSYSYNNNYNNNYRRPDDRLISYGVQSGRLSPRELEDLRRDQQNIQREEQKYLSDGYLDSRERNDLYKDKEAYKKDLYHELNDGERRTFYR
jgi:hypothetical protein